MAPMANPPTPMQFAPPGGSDDQRLHHPDPQPWQSKYEGVWQCHKCSKENLAIKMRCGSCQAWKGGKREGYGKRKMTQITQYNIPQESWKCPCGNDNNPDKVRCTACQKWRGGKRMPKGTMPWQWHEGVAASSSSEPPLTHPWTCDKCGNANAPSKVRCTACPRWKDGKRPKYGKRAREEQEADRQVADMVETMVAAAGGSGGGAGLSLPGKAQSQRYSAATGSNWFCTGCNQLNAAKKLRCGSCQRWKFGKRENMLKKNRPSVKEESVQQGPTVQTLLAAGGAAPLPGMQRQHIPENVTQNDAMGVTQPSPMMDQEQNWFCSCGQKNLASKLRCSSCQNWKGRKRENMKRKSPKQEPSTPGSAVEGMVAMPNQPNMPWKCTRCGGDNGWKKLRCQTCQSWKNAKKQLSKLIESDGIEANAKAATGGLALHQPLDDALYSPPWDCHKCKASVLGTKNRCPSCKSWKGGVRLNLGKNAKNKAVSEPWVCHGCGEENDGKRVRCKACMCWRGGGRPDVAARRAEEKISKGNWMCDRCERSNKVSKVRCGGCQRWRDGQRPAMRKSAKAAYRPYQLPNGVSNHVPQPPPTQMMHPQMPLPTNRPQMPMPDNQPPAPPAGTSGQTTNALNTAANVVLPVENNQLGMDKVIPAAQAPAAATTTDILAKPNVGAWTCTKCTCDNLSTEIICQICECVRDGWMV